MELFLPVLCYGPYETTVEVFQFLNLNNKELNGGELNLLLQIIVPNGEIKTSIRKGVMVQQTKVCASRTGIHFGVLQCTYELLENENFLS